MTIRTFSFGGKRPDAIDAGGLLVVLFDLALTVWNDDGGREPALERAGLGNRAA